MASSALSAALLSLFFFFNMSSFYLAAAQPPDPCVPVHAASIPCLPYFTRSMGSSTTRQPSEVCCRGSQGVATIESNPFGEIYVCGCLNNMKNQFPIIDAGIAQNVTAECGTTLAFPNSIGDCLQKIRE